MGRASALLIGIVLGLGGTTHAADQAAITAAIGRGSDFLKKKVVTDLLQPQSGNDGLGKLALAGLAMLEAGVPTTDPAVQTVLKAVRNGALAESQTYGVTLAILFLDRCGESADIGMIQFLGVRLYASVTALGGWSYVVDNPIGPNDVANLRATLQQNNLVGRPGPINPNAPKPNPDGFPQAAPRKGPDPATPPPTGKLHPEAARYYLAVRQSIQAAGRGPGAGDNSNTQFGLIGLWVAARHGVPADDALALVEMHFLTTQNPNDAGWSYTGGMIMGNSTIAMTCAGLLGLAVGAAIEKNQPARPAAPAAPAAPKSNDPFDNPMRPEKKGPANVPGAGNNPARKAAIAGGLTAIGQALRAARQVGAQNQAGGPNPFTNFVGLGNEYYMLWSLERMAMAYSLETIGDIDWYQWGADFLIPAQGQDGSWIGTSYGAEVNSSFALLFLCRSNLVRDLSRKIGGDVKDPGKRELRGGAGFNNNPPLFAPPMQEGGGGKPVAGGKPTEPDVPMVPPVKPGGPATTAVDALVAADDVDWSTRLIAARDTKGAEHTRTLVQAIPRLDGNRKKEARQALADRLTRMTASSLRTYLKDEDPELRRAASLACAMKDDKTLVPDLIERITDPSEIVVRAVRAALMSLTEQDFGPQNAADEASRTKAAQDWKAWYDAQKK